MTQAEILAAEILRESMELNTKCARLLSQLMGQEDYVSIDEAVTISGLTKRQLWHRADSGQIQTKRLSSRNRVYLRADLEKFHSKEVVG